MTIEPGVQADRPKKQRFLSLPCTRLGWWAVGLGLASVILPVANALVSLLLTSLSGGTQIALGGLGLLLVVFEIAGGIIGLIAVIRRHERSILVWAAILVGLLGLLLIGGEFLVSH